MLQAQELRIGNWILELGWDEDAGGNIVGDTGGNTPVLVTVELLFEIAKPTIGRITQFDPIPLTPEILQKAGFVKTIDHPSEPISEEHILRVPCRGNNKWEIVVMLGIHPDAPTFGRFYVDDYNASANVYYVHQLQNLYFALTGEELEIKL